MIIQHILYTPSTLKQMPMHTHRLHTYRSIEFESTIPITICKCGGSRGRKALIAPLVYQRKRRDCGRERFFATRVYLDRGPAQKRNEMYRKETRSSTAASDSYLGIYICILKGVQCINRNVLFRGVSVAAEGPH